MHIFAHRGIFNTYPENSFRALSFALANDFSIETDVRFTKDNDFVIVHDDNLKRLCGEDIYVASLKLSELQDKQYVKTDGEKLHDVLISFREYCKLFATTAENLLTAIQVKADSQSDKALKKISDYFDEFNLYKKAFVFDLTLDAATRIRKINPKIKIALIVSEFRFEPTIHLWEEIRGFDFDIVWAGEYRTLYSREWFEEVKKTGRILYAMSPDIHKAPHILHPRAYKGYEKTWEDLIRWRSDGVCTDLPFEFREFRKKEK